MEDASLPVLAPASDGNDKKDLGQCLRPQNTIVKYPRRRVMIISNQYAQMIRQRYRPLTRSFCMVEEVDVDAYSKEMFLVQLFYKRCRSVSALPWTGLRGASGPLFTSKGSHTERAHVRFQKELLVSVEKAGTSGVNAAAALPGAFLLSIFVALWECKLRRGQLNSGHATISDDRHDSGHCPRVYDDRRNSCRKDALHYS